MSDDAHIKDDKRWPRGAAGQLTFVVRGEAQVELSAAAAAAAASLTIKPLRYALADNAVIYFEAPGFAVQLSAAALIGASTLAVDAIAGALPAGAKGRIILDPTSYAMRWRCQVTDHEPNTDVITTKTTVLANITVIGSDQKDVGAVNSMYKLVAVAMTAADTSAIVDSGLTVYHHDLWRTDVGFEWPLASGAFQLAET
jgi:hypothetical protein